MAEKIEAYFLRCDQERQYRGYVGQIENTLKAHQQYVGGLIQAIHLTPEIIVICNDEGKLQKLPLNRALVGSSGVVDFFAGNIMCVRACGDEFASIHPEDVVVIESLLIPLKSVSKVQGHLVFETYPAEHCPAWPPFYAVDYSSMSTEGRCELMTRPQDDMEACFKDEPLEVQYLAMTLIFTRWWNSYKHMAPEEPTPEIVGTAIELLWDFLEGKCGDREFTRFQKSFYDSAYKVVFPDDQEMKEDPESDAFYQAHCSKWESKSYNHFFVWLAATMGDIAEKDVYSLYWLPVEDLLLNDIAEGMIDFFETVYQDDQVNPNDPLSGLIRREREIYNTPTFCRVIALLQQDMRTALSDTSLAELRARYREEYLFSPEESAKISHIP